MTLQIWPQRTSRIHHRPQVSNLETATCEIWSQHSPRLYCRSLRKRCHQYEYILYVFISSYGSFRKSYVNTRKKVILYCCPYQLPPIVKKVKRFKNRWYQNRRILQSTLIRFNSKFSFNKLEMKNKKVRSSRAPLAATRSAIIIIIMVDGQTRRRTDRQMDAYRQPSTRAVDRRPWKDRLEMCWQHCADRHVGSMTFEWLHMADRWSIAVFVWGLEFRCLVLLKFDCLNYLRWFCFSNRMFVKIWIFKFFVYVIITGKSVKRNTECIADSAIFFHYIVLLWKMYNSSHFTIQ